VAGARITRSCHLRHIPSLGIRTPSTAFVTHHFAGLLHPAYAPGVVLPVGATSTAFRPFRGLSRSRSRGTTRPHLSIRTKPPDRVPLQGSLPSRDEAQSFAPLLLRSPALRERLSTLALTCRSLTPGEDRRKTVSSPAAHPLRCPGVLLTGRSGCSRSSVKRWRDPGLPEVR
jgi:hypothetical protein